VFASYTPAVSSAVSAGDPEERKREPGQPVRVARQRRFLPLFITQFLGAFNDNVYKNALVILVAFHAASLSSLSAPTLSNLAQALFILPFFLFSATAGQIADKLEKSFLIRLVKLAEIAIMALGATGLLLRNLALLMTALFLMGLHSTVFGPVKYSYLPQHLGEEEIVGGNGLVEMGTFLAILVGTLLGASSSRVGRSARSRSRCWCWRCSATSRAAPFLIPPLRRRIW